MALKSTPDHYGSVAIAIHWVSALLLVGLLASGFRASGTVDAAAKSGLLHVHVIAGFAVLVLTAARILWWLFADTKPAELPGTKASHAAAKTVHGLFYVVILGMAASGIGMMALSGAGAVVFSNTPAALPDFHAYLPRVPHGIGGRALVALLILHVGGALYHHFVLRDRIFARMRFGR